jgi:hypothetical protein
MRMICRERCYVNREKTAKSAPEKETPWIFPPYEAEKMNGVIG